MHLDVSVLWLSMGKPTILTNQNQVFLQEPCYKFLQKYVIFAILYGYSLSVVILESLWFSVQMLPPICH